MSSHRSVAVAAGETAVTRIFDGPPRSASPLVKLISAALAQRRRRGPAPAALGGAGRAWGPRRAPARGARRPGRAPPPAARPPPVPAPRPALLVGGVVAQTPPPGIHPGSPAREGQAVG